MKLDIIMPHYREPWETGKKFFSMLDMQRGVSFDDFRVILVNDGEECRLPDELFEGKKYKVAQHDIPHGGVSAARNAGLKLAEAEWVMFCDFDDMFCNIYALRDILNVIPTADYDMLWAEFISEDVLKSGEMVLHPRKENVVFIHGKLYRRQFLIDNDLWFDETLDYNEDSAYNAILNTVADFHRTGKILTTGPLYSWCYNPGSATTTPGNRGRALLGLWHRNKSVCEAYKKRMPYARYCAMVARTVWDAYHTLNVEAEELPEELEQIRREFREWFPAHRHLYEDVEPEWLERVKAISRAEHDRGDQEEDERWAVGDVAPLRTDVGIGEWLEEIEEGDE